MNIIYCCSDGVYSSRTMAAIHLMELPLTGTVTIENIIHPNGFDKSSKNTGLKYIGKDYKENKVYTLAVKNEFSIISKALEDFLKIFNKNPDNFKLVRSPTINTPWIKIGGYLIDEETVMAKWIKKNYHIYVKNVKRVLSELD